MRDPGKGSDIFLYSHRSQVRPSCSAKVMSQPDVPPPQAEYWDSHSALASCVSLHSPFTHLPGCSCDVPPSRPPPATFSYSLDPWLLRPHLYPLESFYPRT